jgi:hypothetical protein
MTKLIGIEEHFVTADIRAAWAASAIGQEGTGGFSTDYPYQYRPGRPGRFFIEAAALSPEQKELFAHGNCERLMQSVRRS